MVSWTGERQASRSREMHSVCMCAVQACQGSVAPSPLKPGTWHIQAPLPGFGPRHPPGPRAHPANKFTHTMLTWTLAAATCPSSAPSFLEIARCAECMETYHLNRQNNDALKSDKDAGPCRSTRSGSAAERTPQSSDTKHALNHKASVANEQIATACHAPLRSTVFAFARHSRYLPQPSPAQGLRPLCE